MDNSENLTPRQIERRQMAERRRRREKRQLILLAAGAVLIVVLIIVGILLLTGGSEPEEAPAPSTELDSRWIPEDIEDTEDTQPITTEPDPTTAPTMDMTDTDPSEALIVTSDPEPDETEDTQPDETGTEPDETEPVTTAAAPRGDDSEYIFPDSDSRYLTYDDYGDMTNWQLVLARNEIFARHGRRFDNPDIQNYFDGCSWYHGTIAPSDFDSSDFNAYELANVRALVAIYEARS